jgi:hypothetical protein
VLKVYNESRDMTVARLDLARGELTMATGERRPLPADPNAVRHLIDHERYAWQMRVASP